MTKKRKQQKPSEQPSEFALQLKRQRAADAMLASGQGVFMTNRQMGEHIARQLRARKALMAASPVPARSRSRSRKPSR